MHGAHAAPQHAMDINPGRSAHGCRVPHKPPSVAARRAAGIPSASGSRPTPLATMSAVPASWTDYSNPDITFVRDSLSCHSGFYVPHLVAAYIVFASGLACMLTRLWSRLHFLHVWLGKTYILAMLWATAFSCLIHNTGLPTGVLWSFLWCLLGLTIGWTAISIHQVRMQRAAYAAASKSLAASAPFGAAPQDLGALVAQEKAAIAARRTFLQRLLSLKALHGVVMFVSWINIAGRVFVTRPKMDFTCYTYPAWKPMDTRHALRAGLPMDPVPFVDPVYWSTPWARTGVRNWAVLMALAPAAAALVVGAVWALVASRRAVKPAEQLGRGSPAGVTADVLAGKGGGAASPPLP